MQHGTTRLMLIAALLALAVSSATLADNKRITITGVSKALVDASANKMDNNVAYATVTVTNNGAETIYYVYGWGGVICARNDGKTVEVTGFPGQTADGKPKITAASVGVKIIVVK